MKNSKKSFIQDNNVHWSVNSGRKTELSDTLNLCIITI